MARKRILQNAVTAARGKREGDKKEGPQINPFAQREGALSDIAQGRIRDVRLRMLDPKVCRMWERHNRIYDLLNHENCADLINSIRAQGKQEIPALVRRLKNDPEGFEYEVISGARRHFAVSYLRDTENRKEIFYLAEVRDLADEEAFRFADLENRGRQDISDYERGREYQQALADYYGGNLTRMAQRMEVSKALLSSYISLARLPREVLDAYGDPRQIAVRHGQQLSPLLKGDRRDAVLERAGQIARAQDEARAIGGAAMMSGAEVFKQLKAAAPKLKPAASPKAEREGSSSFLTGRIDGNTLKLEIDLSANPSSEAVASAVVRAYERMGGAG
jgi:ParB family chromosome partitioning protein